MRLTQQGPLQQFGGDDRLVAPVGAAHQCQHSVGLVADGELHPLQRNILAEGGVQCGYCTPGMLMSATALLERCPNPTDEDIRIGLSGNLCRCTGYAKIIAAVRRTAVEATNA